MKFTMRITARFALLALVVILSVGSASAQTNVGEAILDKMTAQVVKLQRTCAPDLRKFCRNVTPGEGRVVYCLQAYADKINPKCAYELGETETSLQASAEILKDAVTACKAEISGVCGKTLPGQGRLAACLIANKTTASKDCADRIQRVEALAAK